MDLNRNQQQPQAASAPASSGGAKKNRRDVKLSRLASIVLGGALIVLVLAVVAAIGFGAAKPESKFVDETKLQAVFLNTGQVYFGNIKSLNNRYVQLTNIYYLQTNNNANANNKAATSGTNVTLVKLGCELHEPFDQMLINRDQVTFWENLGDNGQVAKAVATFEKQNPNGQKCADQSSSSSNNSGTNTQPATNNSSSNSNSSNNNTNTNSNQ